MDLMKTVKGPKNPYFFYLSLETDVGRSTGPAVIDMVFRRKHVTNMPVVRIFSDLKPVSVKRLEMLLFNPVFLRKYLGPKQAWLKSSLREVINIGHVNVYIPHSLISVKPATNEY